MGEALAELGDLDAAVEYLHKAIDLKPDCYKFYNTLGWVFIQNKKFDDALNYYNQAIKLNPKVLMLIWVVVHYLSVRENYKKLKII